MFGYSGGGSLAFHVANAQVDRWASLVVLSGSSGFASWVGGTEYRYPPNGGIGTGTKLISLYLAVGTIDDVVPPGNLGLNPATNADTFLRSDADTTDLTTAGVGTPGDVNYAYRVRVAPHVIRSYLLYNDDIIGDFNTSYPSPDAGASGLVGVGVGGNTRGFARWEASAWSFMKGAPQP